MFAGMTVRDNLELGAYRRRARPERDARLGRVHELFPVLRGARATSVRGRSAAASSRCSRIGRALMAGPRLLLLDEPSLGLAPVVVDTLFDVLQEINAAGVSILLVEQNVTRALAISQRGYLLSEGTIVLSGAAESLLHDPEVQRVCLGV